MDRRGRAGESGTVDTPAATDRAPGRSTLVQRVYRRGAGGQGAAAAAAVEAAGQSSGAPLPDAPRARLESSLDTDLGGVRVHEGTASRAAAAELGAQAFSVGQDIHFGAGHRADDPFGLHLLAHEVAHTVQQRDSAPAVQTRLDVSEPGDAAEVEAERFADHVVRGAFADPAPALTRAPAVIHRQPVPEPAEAPARAAGDLRDPTQFPTYEEFAAAFQELGTFRARDTPGASRTGFRVLGDGPADDTSADEADHGPTRRGTRPGEAYIDHPTRTWVADHLPPELRMAVYELPADCADVAILLRHVWLYARGRTETYGSWTVGVGAGATERTRASHLTALIRDHVYSGSVSRMVGSAYGGARSFAALEPLLHAGDVLVWQHHDPETGRRSGGHTQTIQTIDRDDDGHITSITLLQGNQPVFADQAAEIQDDQRESGHTVSSERTLRNLPGRRIERSSLSGGDLQDVGGVWTWSDDQATSLLAAGPPSGVTRPRERRIDGERRRRISDWSASLTAASASTIEGVFEAFLAEVRAGLEGGSTHAEEIRTQALEVASAAGRHLAGLRGISSSRRRELADMLAAQARSFGRHLNPSAAEGDAATFEGVATRVLDAVAPAEE